MFVSNISFTLALCIPQLLGYSVNEEDQDFVPRVVNGWPAKLGDVPYQLAFKSMKSRNRNKYRTFCGGSIIGPNKVLSAAHCFKEKKSACQKIFGDGRVSEKTLERIFAVAGNLNSTVKYQSTDSIEHGQWRRLKSMTIPRKYKFPKNDIAVGFTKKPFVFNNHVNYIPYATVHRDYNGQCLVSGYGRISNRQLSNKLMLAHLEILSISWCSKKHRKNMRKFVCTSDTVSDVQKGDSGGPLVCSGTQDPAESSRGVLVGVVSGNRRRAGSFFTRVSSFKRFIDAGRGCGVRANVVLICLIYCGLIF